MIDGRGKMNFDRRRLVYDHQAADSERSNELRGVTKQKLKRGLDRVDGSCRRPIRVVPSNPRFALPRSIWGEREHMKSGQRKGEGRRNRTDRTSGTYRTVIAEVPPEFADLAEVAGVPAGLLAGLVCEAFVNGLDPEQPTFELPLRVLEGRAV